MLRRGERFMKKNPRNVKTSCFCFLFCLLFFAGTLGAAPVSAKVDKPVFEEQIINIDDPMKVDEGTAGLFNLADRDMQVDNRSDSTFLSKSIIPQYDKTAQEQDCISNGGAMWVNGPFEPEIAAQVQQNLEQIGIDSIVEARSYGEIDNCNTYTHQGVDFTVTLQTTELSAQSVNQEVIDDILPILTTFGKPNLGNVTLVDFLGEVIPINSYDTSNDLQALDADPLPPDAIFKKVYVIVYDPLLNNGQTLSEYKHWSDHSVITQQTIDFFKQASSNKLNYNIVDTTIVTSGWPELIDGFSYTESDYLAVLAGQQSPHNPIWVNYNKIVNSAEFDICGKLNRGEIDEVWVYNGPWFGFYESTLAGPGAYYFNSDPVSGSHGCNRIVPIMGPSVERIVDEAVHNFTHRTESTMAKVYGSWQQNDTSHNWNKFALVKAQSPNYSYSGCGSSHYPPNGTSGYDYGNVSAVLSNCADFANYPNLGDPLQVSQPVICSIWSCTSLGYHNYWYSHFPSSPGCGPDNVANDWWNYIANPAIALYPPNACQPDMRIISGNAGIGSAILTYTDGAQKVVTSDSYGNYFLMVSNQWSGTITPTKDGGYTFSPASRNYTDVQNDSYNQDYTAVLNGPEISVKGNNITILDGDTTPSTTDYTNLGSIPVASGSVSRTFTIYNIGAGDLNLTDSPRVIISGTHASDFSVTVQPSSPIVVSGSTTFTVVFDPSAGGVRSAFISIANDDSNENPYNFSIQGTGTTFPEIDIQGNGSSIRDGDITPSLTDHTDFGSVSVAGGTVSHTFTIYNIGDGNLTLTGSPSKVLITGTNSSDFTVTVQPSTPITPGGSTTFTVVFDPGASGLRTASLSIYSNDSDENLYNFNIQGMGTNPAGILYAKPAASGTGNCSSWANACTLQTALTGAFSGDEIWVAAGTYKPTTGADRNTTFQLKSGVAVYGGFAGTETARDQRDPAANLTILSGDLNGNDVGFTNNVENVYHVVTGATGAILDGFTITAGHANGAYPDDSGGGMYNWNSSSPTLTNITFSGNSAHYGGGGMETWGGSNPTLTNVTFSGNSSDWVGGGMQNENTSSPTLMNVTFSGNSAVYGGGISNYECGSSPMLTNVTFSGNSASQKGGGMTNGWCNPQIRNTIFWGNTAPSGAQIYNNSSTPSVSDSVVQGGYAGGTNIITADPLLGTLGGYGGFTQTIPLLPGSSAIDTGNDTVCDDNPGPNNLDQRSVSRVGNGAHCDIGAYESRGFTLTKSGGDNQIAGVNTAFTTPLSVTLNETGGSVLSGVTITFTAPSSGASITSTNVTAPTNASGIASISVTANGTAGSYNVTASADASSVDFALSNATTYALTYTAGDNGSVTTPATSPTTHNSGDIVTIMAEPAAGYHFVNWTGDVSTVADVNAADTTITMNGNYSITANFAINTYDLTYTAGANGSITGDLSQTVNSGDSGTEVTAVADTGYHFVNWSDGILTASRTDTNVIANVSVTANFAINNATTFYSSGSYDGWVLESGENTKIGGSLDSTATTFRLGDDAAKKQYRGILSFSTKDLPDTAVITKATLKVRKQTIVGGGNPVTTFKGFMVDIKKGYFGTSALQAADFQTAASKTYGPFKTVISGVWHNIDLTGGKAYINKTSTSSGLTQIRLRFYLDDNNNTAANYLSLYSGNAGSAYRPQLVIEYYVP
jgi:hypothetical protein